MTRKKKATVLLSGCLALVAVFTLGYTIGQRSAMRDVSPAVRKLLHVWFQTDNVHKIKEDDAKAAITAWKEYLTYETDDNAICWEVLAFCKLNGLWSGKAESPSEYTKRNLTSFFKQYKEKKFSHHYAELADKLYRDLTSDTNRFDYTAFEQGARTLR